MARLQRGGLAQPRGAACERTARLTGSRAAPQRATRTWLALLLALALAAPSSVEGNKKAQGSASASQWAAKAQAAASVASASEQEAVAAPAIGPGARVGYLKLMDTPLTDVDPQAVCNDGSPANFYFRKGADPTLWLVYLEGGMWCYSEETCQQRFSLTPWEMSSAKMTPTVALGGIFETSKKNPWATANIAYLPYCSSDAWIGDIGASNATWNWAFRGQRILAAALHSLVQTQGLGAKTSTGQQRLLLSGCSAGARGAMMNLDYIDGILEGAGLASGTVEVQGLLDSPLWVNVEPSSPHIMPLSNETRAVYEVVNATGRLGPLCAETFPAEEDRWMCLFGAYRMPMLQTPYLLNAAQYDKFELPYYIGGTTPAGYDVASWHPSQAEYANAFGPAVLAVVNSLPTAAQSKSGVFSSACFRHCTSDSAAFWNVAVVAPGEHGRQTATSLRDAAQLWYFGRAPKPYRVVQDCVGFRCGNCTTKTLKQLKKSGQLDFSLAIPKFTVKNIATIALALVALMACGVCVLVRAAAGRLSSTPKRLRAGGDAPVVSLRDKWADTKPGARMPGRFGSERSPLLPDEL